MMSKNIFNSKNIILIISLLIISLGFISRAQAQDANFENKYFSDYKLELSPQEKRALNISKRFQTGEDTGITPFAGKSGSVQFVYGAQAPSVVCAILQVCDIALQPGEQVNSIQLGDAARWTVEPAISGTGANEIQHLMVKPLDVGLLTSLVVTTDRRTYHIQLKSDRSQFMPQISFVYPEEALDKWQDVKKQAQQKKEETNLSTPPTYLEKLYFGYSITGEAEWKPIRVYNDGKKTIIEMPETLNSREAPILLIIKNKGNLMHKPTTAMVNYRLQGDRYVVDSIFDQALLVSGVGRSQEQVLITRQK